MQLNKLLKLTREEKGFSQNYVAEQSNISLSTYRRLERGENVGIYYIQRVADFLEIKIVAVCQ